VTFDTALAAGSDASSSSLSSGQIATLSVDPAFQHAFAQQTMNALSITDPADPRVAAAWNQVTAGATPDHFQQTPNDARDRSGLTYPGAQPAPMSSTGLGITFNGQTLKLPTSAPSYMGAGPNGNINLDTGPWGGILRAGAGFLGQVLQPGQPVGTPHPGVTPTISPTITQSAPGELRPGPSTGPTTMPGTPTAPPPSASTPAPGPGSGPQKL